MKKEVENKKILLISLGVLALIALVVIGYRKGIVSQAIKFNADGTNNLAIKGTQLQWPDGQRINHDNAGGWAFNSAPGVRAATITKEGSFVGKAIPLNSLSGTGNDYACINASGSLF